MSWLSRCWECIIYTGVLVKHSFILPFCSRSCMTNELFVCDSSVGSVLFISSVCQRKKNCLIFRACALKINKYNIFNDSNINARIDMSINLISHLHVNIWLSLLSYICIGLDVCNYFMSEFIFLQLFSYFPILLEVYSKLYNTV